MKAATTIVRMTNVELVELRPERPTSDDIAYRLLTWVDDGTPCYELSMAKFAVGDCGDAENGPMPFLYVEEYLPVLSGTGYLPNGIEEAIAVRNQFPD